VQIEALVSVQPGLHLLGLVGPVVVAYDVHIEVLGHQLVDLLEEAQELLGAVARHALPDHRAKLELGHRLAWAATRVANSVVVPLRL
jgi:predicted RNA-binding protein